MFYGRHNVIPLIKKNKTKTVIRLVRGSILGKYSQGPGNSTISQIADVHHSVTHRLHSPTILVTSMS